MRRDLLFFVALMFRIVVGVAGGELVRAVWPHTDTLDVRGVAPDTRPLEIRTGSGDIDVRYADLLTRGGVHPCSIAAAARSLTSAPPSAWKARW